LMLELEEKKRTARQHLRIGSIRTGRCMQDRCTLYATGTYTKVKQTGYRYRYTITLTVYYIVHTADSWSHAALSFNRKFMKIGQQKAFGFAFLLFGFREISRA